MHVILVRGSAEFCSSDNWLMHCLCGVYAVSLEFSCRRSRPLSLIYMYPIILISSTVSPASQSHPRLQRRCPSESTRDLLIDAIAKAAILLRLAAQLFPPLIGQQSISPGSSQSQGLQHRSPLKRMRKRFLDHGPPRGIGGYGQLF